MTKERSAISAAGSVDGAPPTAVVLGATGFVGRNICAAAHAAGWSVTGVVRRPPDTAPPWPVVSLDVARAATGVLAEALARSRPALVVNAAGALWDVTDDELTEGNVTLVERLVSTVSTLPGAARLVHIGSAYEYGNHPGRTSLAETLPGRPASRYAQTKLAGTQILTRAVEDGRIDAVALRIALSVGPFAPRHSVLGGLAHQLAARPAQVRLPPVFGVRDIVDVRDVADAVLCAATAPTVPPVVNIGAGACVELTGAVDALIRIAGSTASIVRVQAPAMRRDTGVGDVPLDIGLARRRLGWAPTRTLEAALGALWDSVAGDTVRR
jgi:nucleoside-diphosphate-sugar epimerase